MTFQLNEKLEKDTVCIGDFALSRVLLVNDQRFPWVILVPRQNDVEEYFDLSAQNYTTLMAESLYVARMMSQHFQASSMNIAALGNVVRQLHVHHVVRFESDECWPSPIWGKGSAVPYEHHALDALVKVYQSLLSECLE